MLSLKPTCRASSRSMAVARAQPAQKSDVDNESISMPGFVKPTATVAIANLIMASPALAEGKLFDFNLTLPVMAGQFLLLMVFLDKTWFTPVGKVLDERDELIRSKLASVSGNTEKISEMQAEAEKVLKEARDAASAAVNEARTTTMAEQEAKLDSLRAQLDRDLEKAMRELETEREKAAASINDQVDALSEEIMSTVLPEDPMPEPAEA
eukprot:jgi/Ulvmu1/12275/UM087_0009.1